jgi:hypothetical protein
VEFVEAVQRQFHMPLDSLVIGSLIVYCSFFSPPAVPLYAERKISEIWEKYAKLKLKEGRDSLRPNALFADAQGNPIVTPPIYLKYR